MPGVARIGDSGSFGDTIAVGSGDVFPNNIPTARLGDLSMGHTPSGHGFYPPVPIIEGSGSVFVNNLPIARLGDKFLTHQDPPHNSSHPHQDVISSASNDVFADS